MEAVQCREQRCRGRNRTFDFAIVCVVFVVGQGCVVVVGHGLGAAVDFIAVAGVVLAERGGRGVSAFLARSC